LVGILICALLSIPEAIKNSFALSALRKENKRLSDELEATRRSTQTIISTPVDTVVVEKTHIL
jgi:hypothetical protein